MAERERGGFDRLAHALMHPVDAVRGRVSDSLHNIRSHPFQTIARGAIGAMTGGAGGLLAGAGFNRYNDWRDGRRGDSFNQNTGLPQIQNVNDRLAQALMGGSRPQHGSMGGNPGMSTYGGQSAMDQGGYNVQQQGGMPSSFESLMGSVPQGGVPGLDVSGLDALLANRPGAGGRPQETRAMRRGAMENSWSGVYGGGDVGGSSMIRGVDPGNGQRYIYRRGGSGGQS